MIRAISMPAYNPAAVLETGGSINGVTIGGVAPAAVTGTVVSAGSYVAGGVAGINATIVIPGVATLTFSKGIITASV